MVKINSKFCLSSLAHLSVNQKCIVFCGLEAVLGKAGGMHPLLVTILPILMRSVPSINTGSDSVSRSINFEESSKRLVSLRFWNILCG